MRSTEAGRYTTSRPDGSTTLIVDMLFRLARTGPYASDVMLADTQLLFGEGGFPSQVVHAMIINGPTQDILMDVGRYGPAVEFMPSDPIFQRLLDSCGSNGNVMLHYVQDASVLDPTFTYYVSSIVWDWNRQSLTFHIGRQRNAANAACDATLPNAPKPPPPPGAAGFQGCCYGSSLGWSPSSASI